MQIISDEKLIEQYLKGDEESLEVLIKRYLNLVFGFVLKYVNNQQTAEDITQEVFLKAWRNLKKLDKKQSFKSWLFTIAKNSSLDFLKKKNPVLFSRFENEKGENALINNLRDKSDLPDKIAEMSFVKSIFDGAIEKMSLKYR